MHYHRDPKNYYREQLLLFIPFFDNEHTLKGDHSTWNATYNMDEIKINLFKKIIYSFDNNNAYTTNWETIESQALELTTKNDTNIWMDKFPNADIGFCSQNITNCTKVEPYNICNEYIVNPCTCVSTILDSSNIDVQYQMASTHEFHSLLQKMNNEQHFIFNDVMYRKNNPNEPIHLFITGGVSTCKTFTLMNLIQALIRFFNRHCHLKPLKKIAHGKKTFNIDGITIHSIFLYHLIVNIYHY